MRVNKILYEQFDKFGHHQSLLLRTTLKRNIDSVQGLKPAFLLHAVLTVSHNFIFFCFAQILVGYTSSSDEGMVSDDQIFSQFFSKHFREVAGLVARVLMYIYNGIYPIMILRQYHPLGTRLSTIMPRTAHFILGNKRRTAINPDNDLNPQNGNTYMIELQKMWSVASNRSLTIFSPVA